MNLATSEPTDQSCICEALTNTVLSGHVVYQDVAKRTIWETLQGNSGIFDRLILLDLPCDDQHTDGLWNFQDFSSVLGC